MRSGILAGYSNPDGSFGNRGCYANLWSSRDAGASAWGRYLDYSNETKHQYTDDKSYGISAIYKVKGGIK